MKIQFEIVALQVERMFEESIILTDVNEINKHFDFIREFIESCGWDYSSYTDRVMGWGNDN